MRLRTALTARAATARAGIVFAAVVALAPALMAGGPASARSVARAPRAAAPTGLESFGDCDALLTHLKAVALAKVGPYGFGSPGYGTFFAAGSLASSDLPATGPQSDTYSSTNNQEAGADESDTVKTDGRRMLVLRNGTLTVLDVTNPAAPVRRSRLALQTGDDTSYDASLLLQGDRALVLLPHWREYAPADEPQYGVYAGGEPVTDVAVISIADPSRPRVLDRVTLDGALVAARLVKGAARLVVDSQPLNLAFVTPQSARGNAAALAANRKVIQDSTIADWLPSLQRGGSSAPAVGCTDVRVPATFAGIGMTSIHTIAMGDRVQPATISLQADASAAYASPSHVFVTASAWVDPSTYGDPRVWDALATSYRTDVHEFDITGAKAGYVASGQVRGHALSQWSLSERAGLLRIATTDGPTWSRPGSGQPPASQSFMTVLAAKDGKLGQVGQVGGIGKGEQIRAVRFDGTTAYVVTFRQVDPFYVLDLSQPARPTVVGQLKVAGYSGYLHPVSAGKVLGVGADVDRSGRVSGARVTLFDVSDRRHPKALSSWTLAGAQTSVEFDAKAFLWWNPTNLAVIPAQSWGPLGFTGAVGLRVTSRSITQVATISHDRGGVKGATACRPLGLPEIRGASNGRLVGYVVIDCSPGQAVAVNGFDCTGYTVAQINQNYSAHFTAGAGHKIGVCVLASKQPVERSVVVGNRLLTLTSRDLLSSDLRTLKPGRFVDL